MSQKKPDLKLNNSSGCPRSVSPKGRIFFRNLNENKAREICQQGNFQKIISDLNNYGLFDIEIYRVKSLYKDEFSQIHFLNRVDLELLTILELFDRRTFVHSLNTFFAIKKKIDRPLEDGSTFSKKLIEEKINPTKFLRATLFHDIGKITIPKFLLNSHFTDEHWAQAFIQLSPEERRNILKKHSVHLPAQIENEPEEIIKYFLINRIRGAKFVPIKTLFSEEQIKKLCKRNISPNDSLIEIVKSHEEYSEIILAISGYPEEAYLAGNHHNYKFDKNTAKNISSKMNSTIAPDLIHLADIQNALESNRPYHPREPKIKILAFMMDDAKKGTIDICTTCLWIKDELKKINSKKIKRILNHDEIDPNFYFLKERKKELLSIYNFFKENNWEIKDLIPPDLVFMLVFSILKIYTFQV
ncbi:MAG: hypothetical protein ACD_11C00110G0007 [uncultured bacterium]|nr:MAG: hypothetical protein ACD_11C00110G0007 [uncultured bacterium]HBR71450.1 hypothetical protein [Candidatus Moranbacteria bacterium]